MCGRGRSSAVVNVLGAPWIKFDDFGVAQQSSKHTTQPAKTNANTDAQSKQHTTPQAATHTTGTPKR